MIRPNPGSLRNADGKVPTPLGPVLVNWENGGAFKLAVNLPSGMSARIQIPLTENSNGIFVNDDPARAHREGRWWILDAEVTGVVAIEAR